MGQYRQRHRSRPPAGECATLRSDGAADHDVLGRQDGQDRSRRGVAQCRSGEPLRILAILAQHRRRRCRTLPEIVHRAAARRDRAACGIARSGHQRSQEGARHRSDRAGAWPRRRRGSRRHRAYHFRGGRARREFADGGSPARRSFKRAWRARGLRQGGPRCVQRRSAACDCQQRLSGQRCSRYRRHRPLIGEAT